MTDNAYSRALVNKSRKGMLVPLDEERKAEYSAAICAWVGDMRLRDALEREELAQLDGVQRFLILAKGLLPNLVKLCRKHKRADTRAAILVIIHFCADNHDGLCRLSVARFAQILGRKEDTIRDAIADLEAMGVIVVERSPRGNSYWPCIAAEVADMNPSVGWFLDALSDKPKSVGRPKSTPHTRGKFSDLDETSSGCAQEHPQQEVGVMCLQHGVLHKKNTPPLRREIPPPYAGTYRTKLYHSEREIASRGAIEGTYAHTHTHAHARRGSCKTSAYNLEEVC